jgi:flagellar motility protein MotE (MotC chaperone)
MTRLLRDFRLLPLVLIAAGSLLALKSLGLVFDGGYILTGPGAKLELAAIDPGDPNDIVGSVATSAKREPALTAPVITRAPIGMGATPRRSWAQEMFNFPEVTGSVPAAKKEATEPGPTAVRNESAAAEQVRAASKPAGPDKPAATPDIRIVSPAERAILERLQERRKELEARAKELDMREQLLKAAEKRLEARIEEIKDVEGRIKGAHDKKEEAEASRFKGLIAMYENMKAKDAARIFDRLDLKILVDVAGQINPRRMSDILANMSPEAAERLTVEFATRGGPPRAPDPSDLPKIEGRPNPSP